MKKPAHKLLRTLSSRLTSFVSWPWFKVNIRESLVNTDGFSSEASEQGIHSNFNSFPGKINKCCSCNLEELGVLFAEEISAIHIPHQTNSGYKRHNKDPSVLVPVLVLTDTNM